MQKSNLVEFNPEDVKSVYVFGLSLSSSVRFQEPTPLKLIGLKLCENKKEVRKPELNGYVRVLSLVTCRVYAGFKVSASGIVAFCW